MKNQPNQQPFYQDSFNLHKLKTNVSRVKPLLSAIVEAFGKLEIQIISINEISDLLAPDNSRKLNEEKLTEFVFTRLHPVIPEGMDREKYKELCTMPDTTALIELFEPLRAYQDGPKFSDIIYFWVYEIKGGKVEVNNEQLTEACRPYQEFIESPIEEKRLNLVNQLCDLLTQMADLTAPGQFPGTFAISNVCTYSENKFIPLSSYIKTGVTSSTSFISGTRGTGLEKSSPSPVKAKNDQDTPEAAMARQRND